MKNFLRVFYCLFFVTFVFMGFFSRRGWLDYLRVEKQNKEIEEKIARYTLEKAYLEKKIRALKQDPRVQEKVIRQGLGFVREGDILIEFDEKV